MKFNVFSSLLLLSFTFTSFGQTLPSDGSGNLVGDVVGCFKSEIVKSEKKRFRKQKIISEKRILLVKDDFVSPILHTSESGNRYVIITGKIGNGVSSFSRSNFHLDHVKITTPENALIKVEKELNGGFIIFKDENGKTLAETSNYLNENELLECSTDEKQVQAWAQELYEMNPFKPL